MATEIEKLSGKLLDVEKKVAYQENMSNMLEVISEQNNSVTLVKNEVKLVKKDVEYLKIQQTKTDNAIEKTNDRLNSIEKSTLTNTVTIKTIDERTIEIKNGMGEFVKGNKEFSAKVEKTIKWTFRTVVALALSFFTLAASMILTKDESIRVKREIEVQSYLDTTKNELKKQDEHFKKE